MSAVEAFLALDGQIVDVRSPSEFAHAHIPGACNIPLFSDHERALVGTTYKKVGKAEAIRLGVELVGPRLKELFSAFESIKTLKKIYCYRGGMRSGFVCAFLTSLGIRAVQLEGGYKAFRKKILATFDEPLSLCVLGGLTGSGKTELLHRCKSVIDLEALACHRGSVFGELQNTPQPTTEMFENRLGCQLLQARSGSTLWVEDESRMIGSVVVPNSLYAQMKNAPLYMLECPLEERVCRIERLYGSFPKSWWVEKTQKIQRQLGGEMTKKIIETIEQGRLAEAIVLLLSYYDRAYRHAVSKHRGPVHTVSQMEIERVVL